MSGQASGGRPRPRAEPPVKERILDSACRLFYQEGLHAVGIDRVIAESGAAKASLYGHFHSKDELIAACLDRQGTEWRSLVETRLAESTAPPAERILLLFDLLAEWAQGSGFRGCPFQNAASELGDTHPARAVIERHRGWLHALLRGLVAEAGLRPPEPLVQALVVLHDGAMATAMVDRLPHTAAVAGWAAERLVAGAGAP